jgi:hypothetical protein
MCTKKFRRQIWKTVEDHPPTAWQHPSTYGIFDEGSIANNGLENHGPDLAPSDFHLFGPMKVHLQGQKLLTDNELAV